MLINGCRFNQAINPLNRFFKSCRTRPDRFLQRIPSSLTGAVFILNLESQQDQTRATRRARPRLRGRLGRQPFAIAYRPRALAPHRPRPRNRCRPRPRGLLCGRCSLRLSITPFAPRLDHSLGYCSGAYAICYLLFVICYSRVAHRPRNSTDRTEVS